MNHTKNAIWPGTKTCQRWKIIHYKITCILAIWKWLLQFYTQTAVTLALIKTMSWIKLQITDQKRATNLLHCSPPSSVLFIIRLLQLLLQLINLLGQTNAIVVRNRQLLTGWRVAVSQWIKFTFRSRHFLSMPASITALRLLLHPYFSSVW